MARERLGGEEAERGYRLPRAAGLHLTLLFLGGVPAEALERLQAALGPAFAGLRAPQLVLDAAGAFPRRGRERVLWVGVREQPAAAGRLALLQAAALAAAEHAGCEVEREQAFHAHVTVARPRHERPRVPESFYAPLPALPWRPGAAALVESVLGGGPASYRVLVDVPLQEA